MDCTWAGCFRNDAVRISDNGTICLCPVHKATWEERIAAIGTAGSKDESSAALKKMVGTWVKAQGGAEAAAKNMRPAAESAARLLSAMKGARR